MGQGPALTASAEAKAAKTGELEAATEDPQVVLQWSRLDVEQQRFLSGTAAPNPIVAATEGDKWDLMGCNALPGTNGDWYWGL